MQQSLGKLTMSPHGLQSEDPGFPGVQSSITHNSFEKMHREKALLYSRYTLLTFPLTQHPRFNHQKAYIKVQKLWASFHVVFCEEMETKPSNTRKVKKTKVRFPRPFWTELLTRISASDENERVRSSFTKPHRWPHLAVPTQWYKARFLVLGKLSAEKPEERAT